MSRMFPDAPLGITASDGVVVPVDSCAQVLTYNGDNTLNTISVSFNGSTYVQTYTYTSGKVTGISQWVKQ